MKYQYNRGFCLIILLLINAFYTNAQRNWGKEDLSGFKKDAPFVALLVDKVPADLQSKVIRSFGIDGIVISQSDLHLFQKNAQYSFTAGNTFKLSPTLFTRWNELKDLPFTGIIQLKEYTDSVLSAFADYGFEWIYRAKGVATVKNFTSLSLLVENKYVVHIDLLKPVNSEGYNGWADLSLHGITQFRKQLDFDKIPLISIREGMLDLKEIDLHQQLVEHETQPVTVTSHSSQMAILVAGQGNTDFSALGAVPGAKFVLEPMSSFFPLMNTQYPASLQLNSYGSILEWYYSIEAQSYDEYIRNHHTLFVFSSGNSGVAIPTDGKYKGIPNYSNLTGAFKQAKNNLLIGGLEHFHRPVAYSSSGPTFDGRLKPELVAIADNGTSSSAAVAVGIAAGVYSELPPQLQRNDLVKAILITSADDIHQTGISYQTGYGLINAQRAVQLAKNEQYFTDEITPNETRQHILPVPSGNYVVRVALVWNDPAAIVNTTKALVNDLDFYLEKNGEKVKPWVLSSYPATDSLKAAPQRKTDTLNVVELISDTLQGGHYQLVVNGSKLIDRQQYAIAYQVLPLRRFEFTHPTKDDILIETMNQYVRWNTDLQGKGKIFYKNVEDDENGWIEIDTIRTELPVAQFNNFSKLAQYELKIETEESVYYSDSFWVMPKMSLRNQYLCDNEALFKLFNDTDLPLTYHLQKFDLQTATWITTQSVPDVLFEQNITADHWWRVGVDFSENHLYPTPAIQVKKSEEVCFQGTLLADAVNDIVALNFQTWALHAIEKVELQKMLQMQWKPIYTFEKVELGDHLYRDEQLINGANIYRAKVLLKNGQVIYTPQQTIVHMSERDLWIYPNPARVGQKIEVVIKDPQKMRLFLYSNEGRLVQQIPVTDINTTINIPNLRPGVYFLAMVYETQLTTVKKIIIQ